MIKILQRRRFATISYKERVKNGVFAQWRPTFPAFNDQITHLLAQQSHERLMWEDRRLEFMESSVKALSTAFGTSGSDFDLIEYGSNATPFALSHSDCDLFLKMGDLSLQTSTSVADIGRVLGDNGFEIVAIIDAASIPVVKYRDKNRICGDIALSNPAVIYNTQLMKAYGSIHPIVPDFVRLVKLWAKSRGISDARACTLCSYGWTLLALHFLQSRISLIVNLQKLYSGPRMYAQVPSRDDPSTMRQIDISFERDETKLAGYLLGQPVPLVNMFATFLQYFGHQFDYKNHCVSLSRTGLVSKSDVAKPANSKNYLIIQDPIEPERNIANSVWNSGLGLIQSQCNHSRVLLGLNVPLSAIVRADL